MKKRFLLSGLILVMLAAFAPLAVAQDVDTDSPQDVVSVYIDEPQAQLSVPSTLIGSTMYVSIREFSIAMGAESVTWNSGTASVSAPGLTVSASVGRIYLVANGRYLFVPTTCLLIDNSVMVPVRVIAEAFDASVTWDEATQVVIITKGSGAIEPGEDFYDPTDLYWMSKIISAESRGESIIGKIAVGGVIMNRVVSPAFPDTVYDVIFDNKYGVQFTPAYSGAIYNTPSEESIIAAKIVLDGGNTAGDSLYFSSSAVSCWAKRNRPYAFTIGNHSFFA